MKILHVITTINLGGAENHLFDLISAQRNQGLEVGVAYLKGDSYRKEQYEKMGVKVFNLNIPNWLIFFKFATLVNVLRFFKPSVVHAHMPPAELLSVLSLAFFPDIPLVTSKHNDEKFAPVIKNFYLAGFVARRASRIICISSAVKNYIEKNIYVDTSKLRMIYYSVNLNNFKNTEAAKDLVYSQGKLIFGTIARLTPQKSLHTLIEAFAMFLKDHDSQLIIVGSGELEKELKELASRLGLENHITWTGKRSDIPEILKAFDVFILPSIYEGFGLVLLEAMAAGVPIIASRVSAIPEVLDQGRSGLLFKVQDVQELKKCMEELVDDEKRFSLAREGLKRVTVNFNLERMERETRDVYFEVITPSNESLGIGMNRE